MNIRDIEFNTYSYLSLSTTAKHKIPLLRLPDREFSNGRSLNFLVTDRNAAIEVLRQVDGLIPSIIVDVERKQDIDLLSIAKQYISKSVVYGNKPNDFTMEAADILLQQHFDGEISGKKVLMIGTGNIAFKLALRLAERNVKVFIEGRNANKVLTAIDAINMILPKYSEFPVEQFNAENHEGNFDALIPFISSEKVVDKSYINLLNKSSISIDGGIGNFTEGYIANALKKNSKVIRLDVRISLPFAEASLKTSSSSYTFFEDICGSRTIDGVDTVAGGVIGRAGVVIVNQIKDPTQVIGIANGYGGVKSESTLSTEERRSIELLREQFE